MRAGRERRPSVASARVVQPLRAIRMLACSRRCLSAICPEHTRTARRKCSEQRRPQAGRGQELGNTAVRRMRRAGRVGDAGRRGRTSVRAHTRYEVVVVNELEVHVEA